MKTKVQGDTLTCKQRTSFGDVTQQHHHQEPRGVHTALGRVIPLRESVPTERIKDMARDLLLRMLITA